jgi:hypothetical protein
MSVINLNTTDFTYEARRVKKIRDVLLENVPVFEDAGWAFDASRFAVWLERNFVLVATFRDDADFFLVPPAPASKRAMGTIDLSVPDSIVSVALANVEDELDAYQGDYVSEAEFAEEFYYSAGEISEDFPLTFAIDWQKVWDASLRFDFDSAYIYDVNGDFKLYFWRNV